MDRPTPAETNSPEKMVGKGDYPLHFGQKAYFQELLLLVSGRVKNFTYITMFTDVRNRLIDAK